MSQTTDIKIKDVEIIPPRTLEAEPIYVGNRSMVRLCKPLSTTLFWGIKADSNNSPTVCSMHDKKTIKAQWEFYKAIKEDLKANYSGNSPAPDSALETELAVIIPTSREMRTLYNESWEIPLLAVHNLIEVILDLPEVGFKSEISEESFAIIDAAEKPVESAFKAFLEGNNVPPSKMNLGHMSIDTDFDFERKRVASGDLPKTGRTDAVDTNGDPK